MIAAGDKTSISGRSSTVLDLALRFDEPLDFSLLGYMNENEIIIL